MSPWKELNDQHVVNNKPPPELNGKFRLSLNDNISKDSLSITSASVAAGENVHSLIIKCRIHTIFWSMISSRLENVHEIGVANYGICITIACNLENQL